MVFSAHKCGSFLCYFWWCLHRNACVNNSLPDYVWLVHLLWTPPTKAIFLHLFMLKEVNCWEAGCSCVKRRFVAGVPNKSVLAGSLVLLHVSTWRVFSPKKYPQRVALGSDSLPAKNSQNVLDRQAIQLLPLRKGLVALRCQFLQSLSHL